MNILFEWPDFHKGITLSKNHGVENAIALDVTQGNFTDYSPEEPRDAILFYWHMSRPVMKNLSRSYICWLDDMEVQYGTARSLRNGNHIQVGKFKLALEECDTTPDDRQDFYYLIYPDASAHSVRKIPEVEDILPNGGDYLNDIQCFNEALQGQKYDDDILKMLEIEYKRFLIWPEYDENSYNYMNHQETRILKEDDYFNALRMQEKEKTLTECILDSPFFMEKAWMELGCIHPQNEIFIDEERKDILKILSPENLYIKKQEKVPELVFQDFYKIGLDSHY